MIRKLARKVKHQFEPSTPGVKPDPKDYSTIVGKGSFVPCQVEAYFLALNQYVDEGARVLDAGFGLGYGLNILAIKARDLVGVDIDQRVLAYCNDTLIGRNPRVSSLSLYNGYDLEFADNSFDVVTCVDVLEHVEDYHRFLDELLRVSRKGVFISTPNRRPEHTNPDGSPKNYWHLREWSYDELDPILRTHSNRVAWHFLNGPWEGPFTTTTVAMPATQTLSPFIFKPESP